MPSRVLTVSSLCNYIKNVFEDELILHDVSLTGEVFEFKVSNNKTFITLKEKSSLMPCLRFAVTENFDVGANVVLLGSVSYSPKTAKVSFIFKSIKLTGEGNYAKQLKELKERLNLEGLFASPYKLPPLIKKVAVLTSAEGAVIHDITSVLNENQFMPDLDVYSVKVQGEDAPDEISKILKSINAKLYDVVLIARGGGGAEDLKAFNSEIVARAVHDCGLPSISAVGHETDYTLCDFCATFRAGTPSIAAQKISDINSYAYNLICGYVHNIQNNVVRLFNTAKNSAVYFLQKSLAVMERSTFKSREKLNFYRDSAYNSLISNADNKILMISATAKKVANKTMLHAKEQENEFLRTVSILERTNPLKLLKSGYAHISKENKPIHNIKSVKKGDMLDIVLSDGSLKAEIKSKNSFKE